MILIIGEIGGKIKEYWVKLICVIWKISKGWKEKREKNVLFVFVQKN